VAPIILEPRSNHFADEFNRFVGKWFGIGLKPLIPYRFTRQVCFYRLLTRFIKVNGRVAESAEPALRQSYLEIPIVDSCCLDTFQLGEIKV
jgi:hypothetical protein